MYYERLLLAACDKIEEMNKLCDHAQCTIDKEQQQWKEWFEQVDAASDAQVCFPHFMLFKTVWKNILLN